MASVPSPPQTANTTVAEVVTIPTGNITASVNLTVSFNIIGAASAPGLNVPEEQASTITLRRGNADKSGQIPIVDSMAVKQYLVGQVTLGDINPLNAASVSHDGAVETKSASLKPWLLSSTWSGRETLILSRQISPSTVKTGGILIYMLPLTFS